MRPGLRRSTFEHSAEPAPGLRSGPGPGHGHGCGAGTTRLLRRPAANAGAMGRASAPHDRAQLATRTFHVPSPTRADCQERRRDDDRYRTTQRHPDVDRWRVCHGRDEPVDRGRGPGDVGAHRPRARGRARGRRSCRDGRPARVRRRLPVAHPPRGTRRGAPADRGSHGGARRRASRARGPKHRQDAPHGARLRPGRQHRQRPLLRRCGPQPRGEGRWRVHAGNHQPAAPRADRGGGLGRAVELPTPDGRLEDPPGHRRGQYHRAQARVAHPPHGHPSACAPCA